GGASGPCQPTPQPGTTPTPTPGQANAYEQLGWTATAGIGAVGIPRVAFAPSAPTVGYICASSQGALELVKTTDGGASWKAASAPSLSGDCRLSVNPTDARDVAANDGNPFTSTILRSRDGGGAWQKQSVGELAFQNWGWAGSTLLVATQVTENPVHSETDLYRSVNGGAFTRIDVNGTLAGEQLGQLRLITGTGATVYLVDGLLQFDPDATQVSSKTYRSVDGGAHWQVVQFAGAGEQIYLIDAPPDGKTFLGLDANNTKQAEVSRDSGATWQKLPAPPTQNFSRLWVAPDGATFATVYPQSDQRVWMAKPGDTQWAAVATLPPYSALETVQWDAFGHPTALWANYATDDRGSAWFLLSHPLS
ncbi:MAG TPA: hypothetical protein VHR15_14180, partial [Ktedonobacterales bacterium]|nr:hypothetical protein [Ktedonobacterales bacterium]